MFHLVAAALKNPGRPGRNAGRSRETRNKHQPFKSAAVKQTKLDRLRAAVRTAGSAVVAFSGGADSTLVAKVAKDELGEMAVAVTIDSPLYPRKDLRLAKMTAKGIGIEHLLVKMDLLKDPSFTANPPERCYMCKLAGFSEIRKVAEERGLARILDGSNADDELSFRPGLEAKRELGVRSPLAEAGLGKRDVVRISKGLGLATHSRAPSPCLATRVPYGDELTPRLLHRIERAEGTLASMGFTHARVRAHGRIARIEVPRDQVHLLVVEGVRDELVRRLKNLGFTYVAVDLEGYRTGSMDEVLDV